VTPEDAAAALRERFGETIQDVLRFRGEVSAVIPRESVPEVCLYMRDDLGFNFLEDITAVDWLDRSPRYDVVYHMTSFKDWIRFRLKTLVDAENGPPTVIPVWPAANWAEREVWDLFGIEFQDHPQLERLLMPEGWIGHPLRKDFPQTQITLPRPRAEKIEEIS